MRLGELLLEKRLLTELQLTTALERQRVVGGLLGDNLAALGYIERERLEEVLQEPPPTPRSLQETGLDVQFLVQFVLKTIFLLAHQTVPELSEQIKLNGSMVEELLNLAKKDGLVEVRGPTDFNYHILRYALTTTGRERAMEAVESSRYVGPAPVPLTDYQAQVQKQTITNERINFEALGRSLADLVLPKETIRRLGPAVNSGKAILLYGPTGNGKTSVAGAIGNAFQHAIYVPYSILADGQIIRVFDPAVHARTPSGISTNESTPNWVTKPEYDVRWIKCRRPVIISGGELTLAMLDLQYEAHSKYYEAPLHLKATGGVFVVDDFGRQQVSPRDLLNRWIVPLERQVDYLTLHTGKKFELPFDQLVIFSTNIPPEELVDAALLRRIHYKLKLDPPTVDDYLTIFRRICDSHRMELPDDVISYLLSFYGPDSTVPLAAFHPKFIVEHAVAACRYEQVPPRLSLSLIRDALEDLVVNPHRPAETQRAY